MTLSTRWLAGLAWLACGLPGCAPLAPVAPDADGAASAGVREARALADAAMERVAARDLGGAFGLLARRWPLSEAEIRGLVAQSQRQRATLEQRFGEPLGVAYLGHDVVDDTFVRFTYLEKFAHHALVWELYFYRPRDVWLVNGVVWNDEIQRLFD